MHRRTFLDLALSAGVAGLAPAPALARDGQGTLDLARVRGAPGRVVPVDPADPGLRAVALERHWHGDLCQARLTNRGQRRVRIREVVLAAIDHGLPADTRLYGESFQMLSQTAGTLSTPVHLGYDELAHYKVPQAEGVAQALTGVMTLTPPGQPTALLGFVSCHRFAGRFYLRPGRIEVVLDAEGLTLEPGQSWELEPWLFVSGPMRAKLLQRLADEINRRHPPKRFAKPPTGWCSWYCFGPKVTAQQVSDNLEAIAKQVPALKYVQLDDGYQPAMGDWLETGKAFGGNVKQVLEQIRARGFQPAIWVAPFIAEAGSHLFAQHPDWFMKGDDGKPLPADKVTFKGWRRGPWYALDGTHPEVQAHFEALFRTMRSDWGCSYFKLDANFWGTMHGGRLHDPKATRIEAYRRGMQAILRGAGDSFILGCNHPIWPSLGLIHGSRSSGDVKRTWPVFQKITRQNLSRAWQNGRLWWNDPDAVVLTGPLSADEYQFHATAAFASGGLILSGDDLTQIPAAKLVMLQKLLPPVAVAAEMDDETLRVGRTRLPDAQIISVFNYEDQPQSLNVALEWPCEVTDFWTGEALGKESGKTSGKVSGSLALAAMPPHSARLLICRPAKI